MTLCRGLFRDIAILEPKFRTSVTWCWWPHISLFQSTASSAQWSNAIKQKDPLQQGGKAHVRKLSSPCCLQLQTEAIQSQKQFSLLHELRIQLVLILLHGNLFMASGNSGLLADDFFPKSCCYSQSSTLMELLERMDGPFVGNPKQEELVL